MACELEQEGHQCIQGSTGGSEASSSYTKILGVANHRVQVTIQQPQGLQGDRQASGGV